MTGLIPGRVFIKESGEVIWKFYIDIHKRLPYIEVEAIFPSIEDFRNFITSEWFLDAMKELTYNIKEHIQGIQNLDKPIWAWW